MKKPILTLSCSVAALLASSGDVHAQQTTSKYVEDALVYTVSPTGTPKKISVIMVPGHNLSSYIYVMTPDGRDGWAKLFADEGYEVHVINDPTFDFSRSASVPKEGQPPQDPNAFKPWDRDIWPRWGFGPREGEPYDDARFPTDDFDVFEENYPWVGTSKRNFQASIVALMEEVGPSILIAHSAGGPQAVNAAMERPDLVSGLVLVEPTGPPTSSHFPTLEGKSMLGVYGDYIDSRNQGSRKTATIAAAELFTQNGGYGEVIDLVEDHGIRGNSHLMMQGDYNDFIAELMIDWLAVHAEEKPTGKPGKPVGGGKGGGKGGRMGSVFASLDTDKNGMLDSEEFAKGPRYANADRRTVREAFDTMDANDDGVISEAELSGGVGRRGGGGGKGKGKGGR